MILLFILITVSGLFYITPPIIKSLVVSRFTRTKISERASMWADLYKIMCGDTATALSIAGGILAFIFILLLGVLIPSHLAWQNEIVAKYQVYKQEYEYSDYPGYSNHDLVELQIEIDEKKRFREKHPLLSFYIGHELDDLNVLAFTYNEFPFPFERNDEILIPL